MWHGRLQHHCLAGGKPMLCFTRLDDQFAAKTMNDDLPRSPMFRQAAAGLEGEQEDPEIAPVDQACLAVTTLALVRFFPQTTREVSKGEWYDRACQSAAGVRPEPLIRLIHLSPPFAWSVRFVP
jgi:hypothetical protein